LPIFFCFFLLRQPDKTAVNFGFAGGAPLGSEEKERIPVGCSYLGIAIFHLYKNFTYNKTVWPPLYQSWDKTYMCQICGTFFKLAN
jgi:hypothetical protein